MRPCNAPVPLCSTNGPAETHVIAILMPLNDFPLLQYTSIGESGQGLVHGLLERAWPRFSSETAAARIGTTADNRILPELEKERRSRKQFYLTGRTKGGLDTKLHAQYVCTSNQTLIIKPTSGIALSLSSRGTTIILYSIPD